MISTCLATRGGRGVSQHSAASASICKRLRRPGINSEDSIPPAYVTWRAGTKNIVVVPARQAGESIPGLLKRFTNTGFVLTANRYCK